MVMTHEEELSELAADVTIYALFVAMLLAFVVDQACAGGWGCAVAHVLSEIWDNLAILVLLLLPLALVLFFLPTAGCGSKAADEESVSVKDVEERPSGSSDFCLFLLLLLLAATMIGTTSFAFYKYGSPELFDLLGHVALFFIFVWEAFVYVRAALSLWRMNTKPKPSNMVTAE